MSLLRFATNQTLPMSGCLRNRPSTATNKFRYVVQSAGRARHSVRAAVRRQLSERRARSDAPYHVSKFVCHSSSFDGAERHRPAGRAPGRSAALL